MARGDMRYLKGTFVPQKFMVKSGSAASIKAGEPVIQNTAGDAEYVKIGGSTITTSDTFVGIALTDSTDTASADGEVYVVLTGPSTVYRAYAKTKSSLSTANMLNKVILDLTSSNWTIDESTTTNGLCQMVAMNTTTGEVDFIIDQTEIVNA
jgi:hypothetical protein